MKKSVRQNIPFFILLLGSILLYALFPYIIKVLFIGGPSYELLEEVHSPGETYIVSAYRVNAGATTDYSVEAYIMKNNKKGKKIYSKYHERDAEMSWISDSQISINGIVLDLSKGETYKE